MLWEAVGILFVNIRFEEENRFLEQRVTKLQKDFLGFQDKFNDVVTIVEKLKDQVLRSLEKLHPEEVSKKLELLEEFKRLVEYEASLKAIDEKMRASEEASIWLFERRKELVLFVRDNIIGENSELNSFKGVVVSSEQVNQFCQDIAFYLLWIGQSLAMGQTPISMPKGIITLALPTDVYREAFKLIRNNKVSTQYGLSERAVIMLRSYINRFLIKRQLQLDVSDA